MFIEITVVAGTERRLTRGRARKHEYIEPESETGGIRSCGQSRELGQWCMIGGVCVYVCSLLQGRNDCSRNILSYCVRPRFDVIVYGFVVMLGNFNKIYV